MTQLFTTPWARLAAIGTATILISACSKMQSASTPKPEDKAAPPPVAVVNGTDVTRAEYDFYVKTLTHGKSADSLTPEQRAQVLDLLIDMQIAATEGQNAGVEANADVAAALRVTRLSILKDAEQRKFLAGIQPTDQELHAEYDAAVAALDKTEYHARHILLAAKDKDLAEQLTKKLKAGAKFEDLAKQYSIDPGSKIKGGDLDWFPAGRMVKPFADALKSLKKGEITPQPVETQFGWHIIQLEDTRDTPPPPFEQVKEQVKNRVLEKKWQEFIDGFKKTAKIEKKL